ncbi:hypothetical protein M5D96_000848 [Drosophila gunungcola]|uniref:Sodium/calcium exchanger membrane region domain-containing protein n=1 Tax=Drosophila gunungcola TaxID=103775 RepID=A0A9Q0BU50_9MUSC|nr:hypothetical protein M5D96_000848 [Drosophila gunungcola]
MIVRRRSRRARMWNMGLLFLIYYCVSVYSAKGDTKEGLPLSANVRSQEEGDGDEEAKGEDSAGANTEGSSVLDTTPAFEGQVTTQATPVHGAVPTWRPKRYNCTPPAIEQFPEPLMNKWARQHGGLILHILVAIFTFFGLAIVCDEYFVASLDRLCEELKLSPDVAGATFMAAGSSAPELATVVIGVFFAKDDIGISGVIGSAVFNIMFVISVCALCSGTVCQLNWWPLLERWALGLNLPFKLPSKEEQSALVTYKNVPESSYTQETGQAQGQQPPKELSAQPQNDYQNYSDPNASWDPNAAWGEESQPKPVGQENMGYHADQPESVVTGEAAAAAAAATAAKSGGQVVANQAAAPGGVDYYKSTDKQREPRRDPLLRPTEGGLPALVAWYKTMPDCRLEQYRNWYPFTFLMSMVWISFYSYFMVWMITVIGSTLAIPDTVMGLTFVAAGVSVPDALSSIAGYGDMAVSNAIGSNVFDILVCLGLPWFIQTAIIKPGSHVNVISKGLAYSTLSLFSTVVFLILSTHLNGWKLDKRLGIILMIWYLFFITLASLYEMNVFGYMNPPECPSTY